MCRILLSQRCRLKNDNFVVVGGGHFACIDGGRQAPDSDVVVADPGNDLDAFER